MSNQNYINVLPAEVLGEIFQLCLPTTMESSLPHPTIAPILLGHISSRWRKTVHSSPRLWTSLYLLDQKVRGDPVVIHARYTTQALYWLERSGKLAFSLSVSFSLYGCGCRRADNSRPGQLWEGFIVSVLTNNAHRLQYLSIKFNEDQRLARFVTIPSTSVAQLKYICIDGADYGVDVWTVFSGAPRLRKALINITNIDERLGNPLQPLLPWAQLTHLAIQSSCTTSRCYSVLRLCHSLTNFVVCVADTALDPFSALDEPLILTHLTHFDISFYSPYTAEFFGNVYFPSLQSFAIRSTSESQPSLAWDKESQDHLFAELHNLRSLTLAYQNIPSDALLKLLQNTKELVELVVDSDLGSYTQFLQTLTRQPDTVPLIPRLEVFDLYLDYYSDRTEFSASAFIDMIRSRCDLLGDSSTSFLRQTSLHVASVSELEAMVDLDQISKDIRLSGVDQHVDIIISGREDASDWLPQPVPLWI